MFKVAKTTKDLYQVLQSFFIIEPELYGKPLKRHGQDSVGMQMPSFKLVPVGQKQPSMQKSEISSSDELPHSKLSTFPQLLNSNPLAHSISK